MQRGFFFFGLAAFLAAPAGSVELPHPGSELDRVIGKDAPSLIRLFGDPVQDAQEGPARRLQFAGPSCILDIYLYPPTNGGAPLATYATARVPDGRDADRNICITILRMRR